MGSSLERLDYPEREYVFNDSFLASYEKQFRDFPEGVKLLKISKGEVGGISDLFLVLPICVFVVADKISITQYLSGESNRHKELSISDIDSQFSKDQDFLGARLRYLHSCGFLVKISYVAYPGHHVSLYTATKETVDLVTKKLDIRLVPEQWSSELPYFKILGRACAGMIASYLSKHRNFVALDDCVCSFKRSYTTLLPEFRFVNSKKKEFVVGFHYAYLHHDERIHTKEQFLHQVVIKKVTLCDEYVGFRSRTRESNIVIAVEDKEDMFSFAKALKQIFLSPDLSEEDLVRNKERLPKIYFTGEGMIRTATEEALKSFKGMFFRLTVDGKIEDNVTPEFLL